VDRLGRAERRLPEHRRPAEVLLFRDAEPRLELVQASGAFSIDGDGEAFRIASEAQRIRLALFDPYLAVPHANHGRLRRDVASRHRAAVAFVARIGRRRAAIVLRLGRRYFGRVL
jgi:hypothetical protein